MFRARLNGRHAATLLALLTLALAGAAGCGGDSKGGGTSTVVTTAPGTPDAEATVAATPLTAAEQTVVAIGPAIDFVPYADPAGAFTAEVPRGWTAVPAGTSVTFSLPDNGANLAIACLPGLTGAQLLDQDRQAFEQHVNLGSTTFDPATTATVAGVPARVIPWHSSLGAFTLDHVWVYFDGTGCAWRIALNVGGKPAAAFRPMLDHVLQTFKPG